MKKLLLIVALAAFGVAQAQDYYCLKRKGVDAAFDWNYGLANGTAAVKIQDRPFDEALTSSQNIPFSFSFYGNAVSTFKVSDNGYITFDAAATTSDNTATSLPSATKPKSSVFAFWGDMELKQAAYNANLATRIFTWTIGSAPNRIHCIQWYGASKKGVSISKNTDAMCFAIRLHETSNMIDVVYSWGSTIAYTAGAGIQNDDGSKGLNVGSSPTMAYPSNATGNTTDAAVLQFITGTQPDWDASVTKLNFITDYGMITPIPVTGTLTNYSKNAITSFDINYSVDGGATVTKNITGVNIQGSGFGSYNFTADPYTPAAKGAKVIEVWASNLNGNADGVSSNDKLSSNFNVHLKVAPRVSLHEVFSSSTCGPCAPGNVNHANIIATKDEATFAVVKYQQDFPGTGDPYATAETVSRRGTFYAINSIPRMEIDGQWDGNGNSFTSAIHDQYLAIPSLVELSAKHNIVGHNVDVYVDVNPLADLPNAKLYIAVCEKITDQNVKSNGETEFHNVVKKMLPNQNGTAVSNIKENTKQTFSKSYLFPGAYRLPNDGATANRINLATENSVEEWNDLEVIVWVQDVTTKKVLQSTHSVAWATAIKNTNSSTGVKAYPNPAKDKLFLEFDLNQGGNVRFDVVNTLGQTVTTTETAGMGAGKNNQTLNTANLANGVYFVNINSNGAISTQRFVVAH